ncbi:MAG: SIMPL domain-containing protein [Bryobacterales bacterium]|nr:SIMPL domain-containing protein [Bryobacterales bacterium]
MNLLLALLLAGAAAAQTAANPALPPVVRAGADAAVSAEPDQVSLDIGVVTQASTAEAAAGQNARQLEAVQAELRRALGSRGEIKTVAYSVAPNYRHPREGGQPVLAGYTATNLLRVRTGELSLAGPLIDAATKAGANRIHRLDFSLKDETAAEAQALAEAALKARTKAEAMAKALGLRVVRVVSVEGGGQGPIRPMRDMGLLAAEAGPVPTPVTPGPVEVRASATVTLEVSQ